MRYLSYDDYLEDQESCGSECKSCYQEFEDVPERCTACGSTKIREFVPQDIIDAKYERNSDE